MKTKDLVFGSMLAVIAAIFQCIPALLSEAFIFLTIFSAIPIYIISRKNPKMGLLSYIITVVLVSLFSSHESIQFLFTNGIVGFGLGLGHYYFDKKIFIALFSALLLTISLNIINFVIGVNIFGFALQPSIFIEIGIFLFCFIYCFVFYFISSYIYNRISSIIEK